MSRTRWPACMARGAWALAALLAVGCRAFPVGMYVPESVLDALQSSRYRESLDEDELARAIEARTGTRVAPAAERRAGYWRLDLEPVGGPFAPGAFDAVAGHAAVGLARGDLLLVKHARAQSLATTLALAEFTFYDHLGVLVERDGRWLVCDSWPSFRPLGKADDFAARFRGGVRATPLGRFLAHYETLLVVRLDEPEGNARLAAAALASLDEDIEYDPYHDPTDPRLSCSEYVLELCARAGIPGPSGPRAVSGEHELGAMLAALGFPSSGFVVPDQFLALPGARSVAWISVHSSRAGARAIEAAFAALHARFRRGDRVADFLRVERFRFLGYRANVGAFLRWAEGLAEHGGVEDRSAIASALARIEPLFFR